MHILLSYKRPLFSICHFFDLSHPPWKYMHKLSCQMKNPVIPFTVNIDFARKPGRPHRLEVKLRHVTLAQCRGCTSMIHCLGGSVWEKVISRCPNDRYHSLIFVEKFGERWFQFHSYNGSRDVGATFHGWALWVDLTLLLPRLICFAWRVFWLCGANF